jgi:hypothetical protein
VYALIEYPGGGVHSIRAVPDQQYLVKSPDGNAPADGEGCLVALVALAVGGLLAVVFMLIGGPELLLEVAFEVAFAGTVVRRLRHFQVVGNWKERLFRSTAPFALAVMLGLVAIAAGLQHRVPSATTFAQACRILYSQSAHAHSH